MSDNQNLDSNIGDQNQQFIKLKVVGKDNTEIYFRIRMTTPFVKLKKSYCERVGVPVNSLRFIYDGKRINDNESPKTLEMLNEDIVEVYEEQMGGFYQI